MPKSKQRKEEKLEQNEINKINIFIIIGSIKRTNCDINYLTICFIFHINKSKICKNANQLTYIIN
mgnify:CR=1 FL=1